jgi:hypothetical protein
MLVNPLGGSHFLIVARWPFAERRLPALGAIFKCRGIFRTVIILGLACPGGTEEDSGAVQLPIVIIVSDDQRVDCRLGEDCLSMVVWTGAVVYGTDSCGKRRMGYLP